VDTDIEAASRVVGFETTAWVLPAAWLDMFTSADLLRFGPPTELAGSPFEGTSSAPLLERLQLSWSSGAMSW
jgi:hypothetical protein